MIEDMLDTPDTPDTPDMPDAPEATLDRLEVLYEVWNVAWDSANEHVGEVVVEGEVGVNV